MMEGNSDQLEGLDKEMLVYVAEMHCQKLGCKYMECMQRKRQQSECRKLQFDFEDCKRDEKAKIIKEFKLTGQQEKMGGFKRPDMLRDMYQVGYNRYMK